MKKKILGLMLAVILMLPVFVNAEEAGSVKIGETEYPTLKEAVEAVTDATATTITVLESHESSGIVFESGRNITIDFGGYTVSFKAPTVGSDGTETIDMQILKNSTIVFKNGKLVSSSTEKSKMFIQNYANLTLKDVEIVATNELNKYALSNNSGNISIEGTTSIKAKAVAFDVYGYYGGGYPNGPQVVVNTTGTIEGDIEVASDAGTPTTELKLTIKNINHVGDLLILKEELKDNVTIENGTYTDETVVGTITPVEGNEVYEIITQDGEYKVVVEDETKIEQGYFGLGFTEEGFEELFSAQEDYEEVVKLIKDELAEKYRAAIYYELVFGDLIDNNFILGSEIAELESAIEVTLDIPATLEKVKEGYTRKYVVIRIHENKDGEYETTALDAKDNNDGTVTFETDKFSTYVLAYEDVKNVENPKTLDGIGLYILLGSLSLIGVAVVSLFLKKEQNA